MKRLATSRGIFVVLCLALCLSIGCGGGASSSDSSKDPVITSFTASPASISFGQSTTLNWDVINISTMSLNNGIGETTALSLKVTPTVTTTYTLTVVGLNRKTITSSVTVTVTATADASARGNRSRFVYFPGNTLEHPSVYDATNDRIYVANKHTSEVEVYTDSTLALAQKLAVPSPTSVDMSADGSLLYVGTETSFFYVYDAATLKLKQCVHMPNTELVSGTTTYDDEDAPFQVHALSDGTALVLGKCINSTGHDNYLYIYNPTANTLTGYDTDTLRYTVGDGGIIGAFVSQDRKHAYVKLDSEDIGLLVYDVASKSLSALATPVQEASSFAVNADGTRFAAATSQTVTIYDSSFNALGTISNAAGLFNGHSHLFFSSDGSRLYGAADSVDNFPWTVIDPVAFSIVGYIPTLKVNDHGPFYSGWEQNGRILGSYGSGLTLNDLSVTPLASEPTLTPSIISATQDSYALTLDGGNFGSSPSAFIGDYPALLDSSNSSSIYLTVPELTGVGTLDASVYFPDGTYAIYPDAMSYEPSLVRFTPQGADTKGGGTFDLFGAGTAGTSNTSSLSLGASSATIESVAKYSISPYPIGLWEMKATIPPHASGVGDVSVGMLGGSASYTNGIYYGDRRYSAFASSETPYQMVVDKTNKRLLWTDPTAQQLVVYSLATHAVTQRISTSGEPASLTVTPDGELIAVSLPTSYAVAVYDASTLTLLRTISVSGSTAGGYGVEPAMIAAVVGHKAFATSVSSDIYGGGFPIFQIDLDAGSASTVSGQYIAGCGINFPSFVDASGDGEYAAINNLLWNSASGFYGNVDVSAYNCAVPTIDQSGQRFAFTLGGSGVFTNDPWILSGTAGDSITEEILLDTYSYAKLNSTGSLLYLPTDLSSIMVFDAQRGSLLRTIRLAEDFNANSISLVVPDPDGGVLYLMMAGGLEELSFPQEPLTVGRAELADSRLTLYGSGFASGSTVTVDGISTSATIVDTQHITINVSSFTGAHRIMVTTGAGDSYSYDYTGKTEPVLSASARSVGNAAQGVTNAAAPSKASNKLKYDGRVIRPFVR
jgi:hypothetical protein